MVLFGEKTEIGDDTLLRRNPDILFNEIDGEVVMLSIANGEYYGLDKVGARIWQLLELPLRFDELVTKLLDEYDVSLMQCNKDTRSFICTLVSKNSIIIQ